MKVFRITYNTSGYHNTFEGSYWASSDLPNTYFGDFSGKKNHFPFIQNSLPLLTVAVRLIFATKKSLFATTSIMFIVIGNQVLSNSCLLKLKHLVAIHFDGRNQEV